MDSFYIVCDKKNMVYAKYLSNLITEKDDQEDNIIGVEDGTFETLVWDMKTYKDNLPTLSSDNYFIFLGDSSEIKKESAGATRKFNEFGVEYGYIGKRAYMKVSLDEKDLKKESLENFIESANKYGMKYTKDNIFNWDKYKEILKEDKVIGTWWRQEKHLLKKAYWLAIPNVGPVIYSIKGIQRERLELLYSAKFMYLIRRVYIDELSKFLGA